VVSVQGVRTLALALAVAVAALVLAGCGGGSGRNGQDPPQKPGPDPVAAGDWPQYRRDAAGSSAAGAALSKADAPHLAQRFSRTVGESTYAQAVVVGGTAYLTTANVGSVVAIDAASGSVRWTFPFDAKTRAGCDGRSRSPGAWGSAAVQDGIVYAASPDGNVYAIDAATGAERWRARVADPSPHGELIGTSVTVSRALGRAYVGVASTARCDQIAGRVAALDLATGAVTSRTLVPEGRRGAALWASLAVDEAAERVYAATGNAIGDRATEPLAQAVVALDARTLEPLDSWQNPTPLEDADFGAAPTLFEAGGRRLVAAASKDGWLYVLDRTRLAAGPVWKVQLAVTANDGQGGDPLAGLGTIVSPAFANGVLLAGGGRTPAGDPGALVALDPATGAVVWSHATPGPVLQPPAATAEVIAVVSAFTGGGGAVLELLDAAGGARLASFDAPAPSFSAPSFGAGALFWATADGTVRGLRR
jgi:polyvinyl alcohol dehydrogenase (cytochrome)